TVKPCSFTRCVHQASLKKIRTVRFSSLTSIFPSRASHPTAIETVDLGALTPFSTALRLDSPLERKKFHTRPAVSPIVLISTVKTSLAIVWHFNAGFQILAEKFFPSKLLCFFANGRCAKLCSKPPPPVASLFQFHHSRHRPKLLLNELLQPRSTAVFAYRALRNQI